LNVSYRFCYAEHESDGIGLLRQDFEKIKIKYVKKGDFAILKCDLKVLPFIENVFFLFLRLFFFIKIERFEDPHMRSLAHVMKWN